MNDRTESNPQFLDDLASLVEGDENALERQADLLADSLEHRDLRHDAETVAGRLEDAGRDFREPDDMEDRVLRALGEGDAEAETDPGRITLQGIPDLPEGLVDEKPVIEQSKTVQPAEASVHVQPDRAVTEPPEPPSGRPAPKPVPRRKLRRVPPVALWLGGVAAAAAIFGIAILSLDDDAVGTETSVAASTLGAQLRAVHRSIDDGGTGISVRAPGAAEFAALDIGADVPPGSTVRTDGRTRAQLELTDGSVVTLNHETELSLDAVTPRSLSLARGELVADVARLAQAPRAMFATPTGRIEVVGTKFLLTASEEIASVQVTRGSVRAHAGEQSLDVKAGEEGLLPRSGPATVMPAVQLARSVGWSDWDDDSVTDEPDLPGIGELRARRPGEREESERPMAVAEQSVKVRIVGNVARTEIEQTFRNDSPHVLEGIYRFPLPSDAAIANLSLEVDGEWMIGAFVEKERAQRIWRGVIRNATPQQQRQRQEEFIWVPGPWRDPALLEWQRGGRFELRIFPIPARGARSIRIAYTQTIAPNGPGRRYVYPLPHSADASTRVEDFDVDVRVAGANTQVRSRGYAMDARQDDGATELSYRASDFMPNGDLVVDYLLPEDGGGLRYWTFGGEATAAPPEQTREGNEEVVRIQRELHEDGRGYALFALRPELPALGSYQQRDYVLVVDASQSMVGERFRRASQLVARLVGEMDRRDRFSILACDVTCISMGDEPKTPSGDAAGRVERWLAQVEPAGASDMNSVLREAGAMATRALSDQVGGERAARVIYVGDGLSTVGHRRASSISAEVATLAANPRLSFTAVGIGADADTVLLGEVARAGGGHYVPWTPGQGVGGAALAVLETTYGVSLENARIEMPDGVVEVAPQRLPTIRAGEELLVAGRLNGEEIRGDVTLRGTVGGEPFERTYPVTLTAQTGAGNAFVPRQWAARTIEQLELNSKADELPRIVALSKGFGVMSRHTSLLVLESEAMFRAFGVDRARPTLDWTGEEDVVAGMSESTELAQRSRETGGLTAALSRSQGSRPQGGDGEFFAGADGARQAGNTRVFDFSGFGDDDLDDNLADERGVAAGGRGRGSRPVGHVATTGTETTTARDAEEGERRNSNREDDRAVDVQTVAADPAPANESVPAPDDVEQPDAPREAQLRQQQARSRPRGPGQWMRRQWVTTADIVATEDVGPSAARRVRAAQEALSEVPDSRDRHRDVVRALSRAGEIDEALRSVEKWIERDRLDPEALTYLADLVGRSGERDRAVRLLSGIVDLRPDDALLHERLANAYERASMNKRACAHRVSLAEIRWSDPEAVGAAIRCERALGRNDAATRLITRVPEELREQTEELAQVDAEAERVRGAVLLDAEWDGDADVDLSIVTPQGTRLSWLGGRTTVRASDPTEVGAEQLSLRWAGRGSYLVEVSRTGDDDGRAITGRIAVRAAGTRRTIPFRLEGDRAIVGRVDVSRRSQMVPVR